MATGKGRIVTVRNTPDALERRAAQEEAASIREADRASKVKRAKALLAEGFAARHVSKRLGLSFRAVCELATEAA